jgi:hypothetical protein
MVAVERAEAETKDQRRELWQEDKKKDHRAEQDVRRDVVGEDARTKELEDQHAADDQVRRLQRDGYLKDYNRDQARLDEEQKIRLLEEKARMALRMQEEQLRIQRQDQLETMRAYAELPADKLLQVAMIQHPHLVAAFQAAQGADNLQQQIAMLNQFRDQLTGVYGENRDQIQKLMLAAVQQIGAIGGNRRGDGGGREDAPAGRDARTLPPQTVQVLIPPATNQAIPSPNPPGQELE